LLTREEEAYFLPYVFSVDESDAGLNYNTAHGYKRTAHPEYRSTVVQPQDVLRK
jgi:hypothetical protein